MAANGNEHASPERNEVESWYYRSISAHFKSYFLYICQ